LSAAAFVLDRLEAYAGLFGFIWFDLLLAEALDALVMFIHSL
jgi:hypothetical protein